jgi:hypothetical protein
VEWDEPDDDELDDVLPEIPDDPDEDALPLDDLGELDRLEPLDGPDDDEPAVEAADLAIDEDLVDLGAPEDHELPILTWQPRARVDGEPVAARLDPLAPSSLWRGAPFKGEREVLVELGGLRIPTRVRAVAGEPVELILGRDVLAGRFLLRL